MRREIKTIIRSLAVMPIAVGLVGCSNYQKITLGDGTKDFCDPHGQLAAFITANNGGSYKEGYNNSVDKLNYLVSANGSIVSSLSIAPIKDHSLGYDGNPARKILKVIVPAHPHMTVAKYSWIYPSIGIDENALHEEAKADLIEVFDTCQDALENGVYPKGSTHTSIWLFPDMAADISAHQKKYPTIVVFDKANAASYSNQNSPYARHATFPHPHP